MSNNKIQQFSKKEKSDCSLVSNEAIEHMLMTLSQIKGTINVVRSLEGTTLHGNSSEFNALWGAEAHADTLIKVVEGWV